MAWHGFIQDLTQNLVFMNVATVNTLCFIIVGPCTVQIGKLILNLSFHSLRQIVGTVVIK